MKKNLFIVLLCVLMAITAVSCKNEPAVEPEPEYKGTFYGWDSHEPGAWVKTNVRAAEGEYDLELNFNKGKVTLLVDGKEIHSYELKKGDDVVSKTAVKSIILQSLNNGKEYSVEWMLPTVDGKAVPSEGWVVDRTEPKSFEIKDGKVSITTTDANIANADKNRFYRFQGKTVNPATSAAETWSVKTKVSFDKALLDDKGFAPSIWLRVVDEAGAALDWAIIELRSDAE